jgi:glutamate/tyrosine decarboxylase-like PLP-dependent enzyme
VIYQSDQCHCSVARAARIAGFRPEQVRTLPTDGEQRLHASAVRAALAEDVAAGRRPWFLVATAGTTNTGAVDPLDGLADVAAEHGLWLHVDAAYGWAAALTDAGRALLHGIARADSVTLDPHKWFAQTFDVGCLLVRHPGLLEVAFGMHPEYLEDVRAAAGEVNFSDRGIALTRRFRAVKIWLSVQVLGVAWFRQLVEHCCRLARLTAALLNEAGGFELTSSGPLSICAFRYVGDGTIAYPDALNRALCEAVNASGRFFLSTTRLGGALALRACFVNWRTTAGDVEELVQMLATTGRALAARMRD